MTEDFDWEETQRKSEDAGTKEKGILDSPLIPIWQLSDEVREELSQHEFSISCYEPMTFILAHKGLNQIINAKIGKESVPVTNKDGKTELVEIPTLRLDRPIINAVPISVKKYDNGIRMEYRYEIKFRTNTNKVFTTQMDTIEGIALELNDKSLVLGRDAQESLTHIINSMERMGRIVINSDMENIGFYIVDGKLVSSGINIRKPTKEEIIKCIEVIEQLVSKHKIKNVLPTILKWSIVSPFSFAMKSYNNWLPYTHSFGFTNTGKTTDGKIVLHIWRLDVNDYEMSFESVNTSARFGHCISKDTFPILINECGALSDERHTDIVEMIKNAVEGKTARAKYSGKNKWLTVPALAPCMLTGNPQPPNDIAYKRKIINIRHTLIDKHEDKDATEFKKWLENNKDSIGILGDFTAYFIMNKPEILKNPWNDIGVEVLSEFYAEGSTNGNLVIPEWINELVERNEIVESIDDSYLIVRSFLINLINEVHDRHVPRTHENYAEGVPNKLDTCCELNFIPFILKRDNEYIITSSIMHELKKNKIDAHVGGSLKGLADVLGFNWEQKKVAGKNMRVIVCIAEDMGRLLNSIVEVSDVTKK